MRRGRWQGQSDADGVFLLRRSSGWFLRWFLWLWGPHHREGKGEGDGGERYGRVLAHGEGGVRAH